MSVARTEAPVGYKTTIVRTIVQAMRAAFDASYPEGQFAELNIVNKFPLTEIEYPAIVVKYVERGIPNAGVGHREYFNDPDGRLRKWGHRRFEGELEFTICALSPLDRDILSNALVEMLSFGRLDAQLNKFFVKVYGDIGVDPGVIGLLHQISLNTDDVVATGESNNIAPWRPEDTMVYLNGYTIDCHGGFYNSLRSTAPLNFIEAVKTYPYIDTYIPVDADPGNQWSYVFDYDDAASVIGQAIIRAHENYYDTGTVIGTGVISAVLDYEPFGYVRQFQATQDDGNVHTSIGATWTLPTIAGNHLFMVIALRHVFAFASAISALTPAGWTKLDTPNINNPTGASIVVFYKLAAGSESGTETVTLDFSSGFWEGFELSQYGGVRCAMQMFEIKQIIDTNLTPTRQAKGNTTTSSKSGYDSNNPTSSGLVFTGSGANQANAWVVASSAVPGWDNTQHIDIHGQQVTDGWTNIGTTYSPSRTDPNSISLTSWLQPVANNSTTDLRVYYNDGAVVAGVQDILPAATWARFA